MRYLLFVFLCGCATNSTALKIAKSQLDFSIVAERGFKQTFSQLEILSKRVDESFRRSDSHERDIRTLIEDVRSLREELKKKGGKK